MSRFQPIKAIIVVVGLIFMLCACGDQTIEGETSSDEPVLWMYDSSTNQQTANFYIKRLDRQPELVSQNVRIGSHLTMGAKVLFLDGYHRLFYSDPGKAPYFLFDHVIDYGYQFSNSGNGIYVLTDDAKLLYKGFGKPEKLLAEDVTNYLQLDDRIMILQGDGQVTAMNPSGEITHIADDAQFLSFSLDGVYAVIQFEDHVIVANGDDMQRTIQGGNIGPIWMTANAGQLIYMDGYDTETGSGSLILLPLDVPRPITVAKQVEGFQALDNGDILYISDSALYVYQEGQNRLLADAVSMYDGNNDEWAALVLGLDESLHLFDRQGHSQSVTDQAQWAAFLGDSMLYEDRTGMMRITDSLADSGQAVGNLDTWLVKGSQLVGVEGQHVIRMAPGETKQILFDRAADYEYVYYGENLLYENENVQ